MPRFLHAADLHLDSPLKGLERYEGAPVEQIRLAPRRALENMVALAQQRQVDLVLIAGDIYDGDWKDYQTGLFFREQMRRLADANIPVVLISGNHDAANKMTRGLTLPDNVFRLSALTPETRRFDSLGVAVHGQSFAKEAVLENLAADYPPAVKGWLNLGLLHTGLELESEHARYAPCTLDDLRGKGYDYWALGHIHQRQQLAPAPHVAYSGNIQGRHIRETGAKGVLIVDAEPGDAPRAEFHPVDVLRWETISADVSAAADQEECLSRLEQAVQSAAALHEGYPLAMRILLQGVTPAHETLQAKFEQFEGDLRGQVADWTGGLGWVEKIRLHTRSPHLAAHGNTPLGLIRRVAQELAAAEDFGELFPELGELKRKLPAELRNGSADALPWDSADWFRELLGQAEAELLDRVQHERGAP